MSGSAATSFIDQLKLLYDNKLYSNVTALFSLAHPISIHCADFMTVSAKFQSYVYCGDAYVQLGDFKRAEALYQKAIQLKKSAAKAKGKGPASIISGDVTSENDIKYQIHVCHVNMKQPNQAISAYRRQAAGTTVYCRSVDDYLTHAALYLTSVRNLWPSSAYLPWTGQAQHAKHRRRALPSVPRRARPTAPRRAACAAVPATGEITTAAGARCSACPATRRCSDAGSGTCRRAPTGSGLKRHSALCERHFDPQFIVRHYEHVINGEVVRIMRGLPTLTPDAVPTIFPESPSYYTRRVPPRRKPVHRVSLPPPTSRKRSPAKTTPPASATSAMDTASNVTAPTRLDADATPLEAGPAVEPEVAPAEPSESDAVEVVECEVTPAFPYKDLPLPSSRWARHVISEKPLVIAYSTCRVSDDQPGHLVTEKLVLVREHECHAECHVYLEGRRLSSFEGTGGTDYPQTLLQRLDRVERCQGLGQPGDFHVDEHCLPPYLEMRESRLHSVQCCGARSTRAGLSDKCQHAKSLLRKKRARLERKMRMRECPSASELVAVTEWPQPVTAADIADTSHGGSVEWEPDEVGATATGADAESVTSSIVVTEDIAGDSLGAGNVGSESAPAAEREAVPYRNLIVLGQMAMYV
ncbi:hypothetical protein HPB50_020672 [Hyalomma asiaticum]|uniref:Uncharacterized protein n=1 Tax=Hyalomma asiaticum TaxID=266040 RepID=A0ACB7SNA2_HYAAI|nr:hypothetical protein HPB50_020672 [Hyalomma asiaticum]